MKNKEFATAKVELNNQYGNMRKNLVNGMKRSMNMTMKLLGAALFILQSSFFIVHQDYVQFRINLL